MPCIAQNGLAQAFLARSDIERIIKRTPLPMSDVADLPRDSGFSLPAQLDERMVRCFEAWLCIQLWMD